ASSASISSWLQFSHCPWGGCFFSKYRRARFRSAAGSGNIRSGVREAAAGMASARMGRKPHPSMSTRLSPLRDTMPCHLLAMYRRMGPPLSRPWHDTTPHLSADAMVDGRVDGSGYSAGTPARAAMAKRIGERERDGGHTCRQGYTRSTRFRDLCLAKIAGGAE